MATLTPEQMHERVGIELVSDWIQVTQTMIDQFADATGDDQFIHTDPVRATRTPFGGTIAHGFLTLSLMPLLAAKVPDMPQLAGVKMDVNYGGERVRFIAPVRSGTHVRGHFKLLRFEEKRPGQYQQTTEYTLEVEGETKPAVIAQWISQLVV